MFSPDLKSIKRRRTLLGLSQHALAKQVGLSQSMLAKTENGKTEPSYKVAMDIFEKLDELENIRSKKAKDVMSKNVFSLKKTDNVAKAIHLAKKYSISQFPIVQSRYLIGSISVRDLLDVSKDVKSKIWHIDTK